MKKAQIEITNTIFMHLIGILGILTFTFLFVSMISSSTTRAEALSVETIYYGYARRLVSSSDCFAYQYTDIYYDGSSVKTFSRVMPSIIDVSKVFDYNHQNCLKYDMVSGANYADPSNPYATYPVLFYEVTLHDQVNDINLTRVFTQDETTSYSINSYNLSSDVYVTVSQGVERTICKEGDQSCTQGCLYSCDELREYREAEGDYNLFLCDGDTPPETITPGRTCWEDEFNTITNLVQPYSETQGITFNCDISGGLLGTTNEYGNVFEKTIVYPVMLRYSGFYLDSYEDYEDADYENRGFIEHPGLMSVRFCVIKIPTSCDPFFKYTMIDNGILDAQEVYAEGTCENMGLPLI